MNIENYQKRRDVFNLKFYLKTCIKCVQNSINSGQHWLRFLSIMVAWGMCEPLCRKENLGRIHPSIKYGFCPFENFGKRRRLWYGRVWIRESLFLVLRISEDVGRGNFPRFFSLFQRNFPGNFPPSQRKIFVWTYSFNFHTKVFPQVWEKYLRN